jgi:hypothetical protein
VGKQANKQLISNKKLFNFRAKGRGKEGDGELRGREEAYW